jgi:hypothetical protein
MRRGEREMRRRGVQLYYIAVLMFLPLLITSCGPNQKILNSAANSPTPETTANASDSETKAPSIEQDIQAMRNADFNFIYVFRRKDGAVLDNDDKGFINAVTPAETNRRRLSDSGRAVIMGSNYRFPPDAMKALTDRFAMENFSKPESEKPGGNANTNSNS